ncbi:threo-3-hydroxy-L-aspartate ammonia-lyase [Trichothermofontia sp.]
MTALPVTYADLVIAAQRLAGQANLTPVMTSRTVNQLTGAEVFFKCENFQRTGAFKFRGAFNALAQLSEAEKRRGVLTYSSGNHAQAIALAGQLLGIATTVIMPQDAPTVKRAATAGYGATIIPYDRAQTTREALAATIAQEQGLTIIPPYDYGPVVAGQGTATKELLEAVGELDWLLVGCGGGGLLSGAAIAAKTLSPRCRVVGVEPSLADDATRSFYSKTLQTVTNPTTIAEGARTPSLGKITFPIVLRLVDAMVTVSEAEIVAAMFFLWQRLKLVVEPTGALATAALLSHRPPAIGGQIGVMISGGNVDLPQMLALISRESPPERSPSWTS